MIKTKTKNTKPNSLIITTGYILFIALASSIILSTTLPFGMMLSNPEVRHFNVIVAMLSLTLGGILPVLLGYIIGVNCTKSNDKSNYRLNGVLFGFLAYWIAFILAIVQMSLFESLNSSTNLRLVLSSLFAVLVSVGLIYPLAIAYSKSKQTNGLIGFKPYGLTLIALIVAYFAISLSSISTMADDGVTMHGYVTVASVGLILGVSYLSLSASKLDELQRVVWSILSLSVALILINVMLQLIGSLLILFYSNLSHRESLVADGVGISLALIMWIVYWIAQVKLLSSKKQ